MLVYTSPALVLNESGGWRSKWPTPSPTSFSCYQHISSPTSVTNIDVTDRTITGSNTSAHDLAVYHILYMLFDEHVEVQSVIFGIQGSFWCEAKQNPRESAVWRDFTWGIDLMDHYDDVSRTGDLWKVIFSSFFRGGSFCDSNY